MFDGCDAELEARRRRAHQLIDRCLIDPATATGPELSEALEARGELEMVVDGAAVACVPQWETSGDWTHDGSATPVVWLVNHTGSARSTAGALRRTGLLTATMPHVHAAATAGTLPLTHLHQLTRARKPEVAELFDRDEPDLVATARTLTADALTTYLLAWRMRALEELARNDPDHTPDHHSDDDTLTLNTGYAGRGILSGDLTTESLAIYREAIEARIETWRRTGQLGPDDPRTYQELYADALLDIIKYGSTSSRRGQPRPLLIAIATLTALFERAEVPANERDRWRAEILGGGPIGQAALHKLMCEANLVLAVTDDGGQPLYLGRSQRLATAAMLLALIARNGGHCEHPGCHATHHRLHAHHITWWENHGPTDITNLALICPHHHKLIHQGHLTLTRNRDGTLTFRTRHGQPVHPPPWTTAA